MSSTTVHSKPNTVGSAKVAGSALRVTEKDLEFPPKGQVFEAVSGYIEEQGNIEIPTGNGYVTENEVLVKQDGSTVQMNTGTYNKLVEAKHNRAEKSPSKVKETDEATR